MLGTHFCFDDQKSIRNLSVESSFIYNQYDGIALIKCSNAERESKTHSLNKYEYKLLPKRISKLSGSSLPMDSMKNECYQFRWIEKNAFWILDITNWGMHYDEIFNLMNYKLFTFYISIEKPLNIFYSIGFHIRKVSNSDYIKGTVTIL